MSMKYSCRDGRNFPVLWEMWPGDVDDPEHSSQLSELTETCEIPGGKRPECVLLLVALKSHLWLGKCFRLHKEEKTDRAARSAFPGSVYPASCQKVQMPPDKNSAFSWSSTFYSFIHLFNNELFICFKQ